MLKPALPSMELMLAAGPSTPRSSGTASAPFDRRPGHRRNGRSVRLIPDVGMHSNRMCTSGGYSALNCAVAGRERMTSAIGRGFAILSESTGYAQVVYMRTNPTTDRRGRVACLRGATPALRLGDRTD